MLTFRTTTIGRNIAFNTSKYRSDSFTIALLVVINMVSPNPILFEENKFWKFINLKLLIIRRVRIIKSPLLEWDVFTDKI